MTLDQFPLTPILPGANDRLWGQAFADTGHSATHQPPMSMAKWWVEGWRCHWNTNSWGDASWWLVASCLVFKHAWRSKHSVSFTTCRSTCHSTVPIVNIETNRVDDSVALGMGKVTGRPQGGRLHISWSFCLGCLVYLRSVHHHDWLINAPHVNLYPPVLVYIDSGWSILIKPPTFGGRSPICGNLVV